MAQKIIKNLNNKGKNNFLCCFLCINYKSIKHKYGHIDLILCRNQKEGVGFYGKIYNCFCNGSKW